MPVVVRGVDAAAIDFSCGRLLHQDVPSVTTAEKNVFVFQWLGEVSSIPLGSTSLRR
jgi:hypothetical protein